MDLGGLLSNFVFPPLSSTPLSFSLLVAHLACLFFYPSISAAFFSQSLWVHKKRGCCKEAGFNPRL